MYCIWVRWWRCGCLVTWFCYRLIAKLGNKTATPPWPNLHIEDKDPPNRNIWWHKVIDLEWNFTNRLQLNRHILPLSSTTPLIWDESFMADLLTARLLFPNDQTPPINPILQPAVPADTMYRDTHLKITGIQTSTGIITSQINHIAWAK